MAAATVPGDEDIDENLKCKFAIRTFMASAQQLMSDTVPADLRSHRRLSKMASIRHGSKSGRGLACLREMSMDAERFLHLCAGQI